MFPHASCPRRKSLFRTFNDVRRLTVNKRFDPSPLIGNTGELLGLETIGTFGTSGTVFVLS